MDFSARLTVKGTYLTSQYLLTTPRTPVPSTPSSFQCLDDMICSDASTNDCRSPNSSPNSAQHPKSPYCACCPSALRRRKHRPCGHATNARLDRSRRRPCQPITSKERGGQNIVREGMGREYVPAATPGAPNPMAPRTGSVTAAPTPAPTAAPPATAAPSCRGLFFFVPSSSVRQVQKSSDAHIFGPCFTVLQILSSEKS